MSDWIAIPTKRGMDVKVSKGDYSLIILNDRSVGVMKVGENRYYAYIYVRRKLVYLHRYLMGLKAGDKRVVDHLNHDGLDNRRENLEIKTNQENCFRQRIASNNTSGFKGVSWYKRYSKWEVQLRLKGKKIGLGYFEDLYEAAEAYNEGAIKHFGKNALLNIIPSRRVKNAR